MRTRAPQNRGGCVQAGPVRFSRREPPWRTMFAATVSAGCKHLAARLPQRPPFGIRPRPCSGAQRAPQNADPFAAKPRRGHVPAGPVRPSPDERPWRTMFAATVSVFCTLCAKPRTPCSGAQRAPQNADPFAAKPRGMRSGRPGAFLAQGTAMANNVRRYGLSRLQASRSPFAPASAFRNKAPAL